MGFLRNRITTVGCVLAAAGIASSGCSGSGHAAVADAATAKGSSALAACTGNFLAMSTGHRSGTTMVTQAVNLTNNGTDACVLDGYPGVSLIGRAHGESQYTWTLRWATTPHAPVTLEPGATAHFDVVYQPATGAEDMTTAGTTPTATATATAKPKASSKPSTKASVTASKSATPASVPVDIDVLDITITLPNTFSQDQMAWYAELLLQDKDANAQTHVTPFVAGAA